MSSQMTGQQITNAFAAMKRGWRIFRNGDCLIGVPPGEWDVKPIPCFGPWDTPIDGEGEGDDEIES